MINQPGGGRVAEVASELAEPDCDCGHPRTLHGAGKVFDCWCVVESCACGNYRRPAVPQVDLLSTTDAAVWAKEFARMHRGDEGLMLSWFANAIETGRGAAGADARERENDLLVEIADLRDRLRRAEPEATALAVSDVLREWYRRYYGPPPPA